MAQLERRIVSRVGSLSVETEQELRAAVRSFVEDVLLFEFGDALAEDPKFHDMLESVVTQACGDPAVAEDFRRYFKSARRA